MEKTDDLLVERTVALSPIESEVKSYLAWLEEQGHEVTKVVWPKAPGLSVSVTFKYSVKTDDA
ncbi:MAG: hypothetical protein WD049_00505 [Candidatus Paceibacterota bacterium]